MAILVLVFGSAGCGPQQQGQQEVHVAVNGSDETGTGTEDAPYATVSAASQVAPGAIIAFDYEGKMTGTIELTMIMEDKVWKIDSLNMPKFDKFTLPQEEEDK